MFPKVWKLIAEFGLIYDVISIFDFQGNIDKLNLEESWGIDHNTEDGDEDEVFENSAVDLRQLVAAVDKRLADSRMSEV